ncbi:hypothetical protein KAR91_64245 [Candidatus Pacearchaeota archaeon]|nr:hypothetical protein [Candidatus Pacearchaeota archaeon]
MKLPGQTINASELLIKTLKEVKKRIGKHVIFLDLTSHSNIAIRQVVQGYHDCDASTEHIWLDPKIPYDAQEAVAAHELAHLIQEAAGFCKTTSVQDKRGNPLIPAIALLGTRIDNMIMDKMADQWAISRGFNIEDALRAATSSMVFGEVKMRKPKKQEHIDWQEYYTDMDRTVKMISSKRQIQGPLTLKPEINTQISGVDYAGLYLRLDRFGLFSDLDRLWAEYWPEARSLGQEVVTIVENIGVDECQTCQSSTIAVIKYFNINPKLLYLELPLTGEVIWAKQ